MFNSITYFFQKFQNKLVVLRTYLLSCAHSQRGFSFLEMLMVLVIVGILTSMAIPRYQSIVTQSEIDGVARELNDSIEVARISAQSYGKNVAICPVTVQQLHAPLTECPTLNASDPWRAWIVMELNANNNGRVLARSNIIPSNILVCVAGGAGNCNDVNSSGVVRVLNGMGQSSQLNGLVNGITIKVTTANGTADVLQKKVILAPTGRVRTTEG